VSSGFAVVSGHAESAWRPVLESLSPRSLTVVVLMGLGSREAMAAALVARGWPPATPAAVVWSASRAEAAVWRGTLGTLSAAVPEEGASSGPGTIVIGEVVSLSEAIAPAAETTITAAGGTR
jgi:siroheme synthase